MSVKVSALCWQIPLTPHEKLVLLRLADYADDHGGNIYPAVATVAHMCCLSERGVQYILKKFMADGLLFVLGNEGGGRGRTRHYCIDLERAGQLAGPGGGHKNGTGKRAQRVHKPCTLSDPDETPQRVHTDAVKGAQALHPTLQEPSGKEEETVCSVGVDPREAPTQAAPNFSVVKSSNVVPIKPAGRQEVLPLPDGWVLPAEWRAWAEQAGQGNVDGAAQRFFDFHFERGLRKTEAGWAHAWKRWIEDNIKRGYGDGAGRNTHQRRGHGDLAAVIKSDLPGWFGNASGGSDGW